MSTTRTFRGPTGNILTANKLSDGNIITGDDKHTLKIWDANTGQCTMTIMPLQGQKGSVKFIAVFPNGNIISGSGDNTLKIWDTNTGQCTMTLQGGLSDAFTCVALLKNGNVISGSHNRRLKIWDTNTGECTMTLQGHDDSVKCVAVLPNGNIVSGSEDKTLKIWDANTGQCIMQGHLVEWVNCVAVLPNGNIISGSGNQLNIWDTNTGQCTMTLQGHQNWVARVTVLPNGNVISGSGGQLKIWDTNTGQCIYTKSHRGNDSIILPNGLVVLIKPYEFELWSYLDLKKENEIKNVATTLAQGMRDKNCLFQILPDDVTSKITAMAADIDYSEKDDSIAKQKGFLDRPDFNKRPKK